MDNKKLSKGQSLPLKNTQSPIQERCNLILYINIYTNLYRRMEADVYIMMQDRPVKVNRPT